MKKILKATIPPTKDQGSCIILGSQGFYETFKQDILKQYNKMRERDGFPPVIRMPSGTRYKFKALWGAIA
jgi:hypothetical protein